MRISDWSSDVCSSDLRRRQQRGAAEAGHEVVQEIKEKEGGDEEVKPLGHDLQARFRRIDIGHEHQRGIDKGMGARARAGSRSGFRPYFALATRLSHSLFQAPFSFMYLASPGWIFTYLTAASMPRRCNAGISTASCL